MTSKFTREELLNIIETDHVQCGEASALARMALAAMDSEPVAVPDHLTYLQNPTLENVLSDAEENSPMSHAARILAREVKFWRSAPLYRHAQPAPEYPETLPCPVLLEPGLRFGKGIKTSTVLAALARRAVYESDMAALSPEEKSEFQAKIADFKALLSKQANMSPDFDTWFNGPDAGLRVVNYHIQRELQETAWNACRAAMLQAGNDEIGSWSNGKNTPTVTSITPAAPDKKLTDDVLDEIIAGAKTSMEQYLALSLKAERKVWRQEGPTDDERIMAIEGMIELLRCGGNGWVIGEMGITRCACGQAGNSPVIPGVEQRIADAVELLKKAAPAMLADNSGPDGPLAGRMNSPVIPDGYVMVPEKAMTPKMIIAVQMNTELGSYAAANLVSAYRLFDEFWSEACRAAQQEVKGE